MHTIQFLGVNPQAATTPPSSTRWRSRRWTTRSATASFESPLAGRQHLPDRAQRFRLAVLRLAGVSTNGSGFTTAMPYAPSGAQVAFIKNNGSISQPSILTPARTASRSWPPSASTIRPRTSRSRCWSMARRSVGYDHARLQSPLTLLTRRRISRSRPARIPSNSSA